MKKIAGLTVLLSGLLVLGGPVYSQDYIADYRIAKEEVLRGIPVEYITRARNELVIAYQHTSHGTHVSRGMYGLPDYKAGDDTLFAISENERVAGKLCFMDRTMELYPPGAMDLSAGETTFAETTRNFLDAPENADVNVVMWSWCDIAAHDISTNYLPGMEALIAEYGEGGSRIGTGEGQREVPVEFVFMTGHANTDDNVGEGKARDQAQLIIDYCNTNGYLCLDYYSIDTHDMDDNYWEDAGDNGNSLAYGGNFYQDYQDAQVLGTGYYENKSVPGGDVEYGDHTTQHITSNRKAYAMWWILARIAGYSDPEAVMVTDIQISSQGGLTEIDRGEELKFTATVLPENASNKKVSWSVINGTGSGTICGCAVFTAVSAGTVQVVASAMDGSGVSSSFPLTILNVSAVDDEKERELLLYPNPSMGRFYLHTGALEVEKLEVISSGGELILHLEPDRGGRLIEVDVGDRRSGIFFVRAYSKEQTYVQRIVISR